MSYEWSKYPDQTPPKSGYYLTLYYNKDHEDYLTKCIQWNGNSWLPWRPGVIIDSNVKGFVQDTHHDYYAPCTMKSHQTVTHVDMDLFLFLKVQKDLPAHIPETSTQRQGHISPELLAELQAYGDSLDKTKINEFLELYRDSSNKDAVK